MPATVEVRFKGNRKDYFLWSDESDPLRLWEPVIVPVERGLDFGRVSATGDTATKKCGSCQGCASGEVKLPELAVVRRATQDDVKTANELRRTDEEARRTVLERVRARQLDMKVSDTEWQWDRKKLTVYFTAEQRVDFRELVRDLAQALHTRIELRQIGARDEAKRLSGVGRCGKEYCCSSWLPELGPVSLALAKDQHLSLNPAQISGGCGRLLCCLKYEHEFYVSARKRFPKEGKTLRTDRGAEKVVAVDIFRERVFLRSEEQGPRIVTLVELREELDRLGEPPPEARGPRPAAHSNLEEVAIDAAEAVESSRGTAGPETIAQPQGDPTQPARKHRRRRRRRGPRPDGGSPPGTPAPPES
ncbi:MAG TPA: regulatory iron-sulfur-containing complex subunit RicT [Gemmatimonadales bacterium]|jgi:cell fate regulator YaaT (PSP1 superfamily)|nr:regulatory iron-sulfur-containing complex subunit RicT [Gemmatimonadales bacterium]